MNAIIFAAVAATALAVLLFAPFTKRPLWRATVTPLASIIGSGFLVSAPLLAREFGGYAAPAMAILIALAALIGWAIRYNIAVVEPLLAEGKDRTLLSIERLSHVVLAFAYFISVAYYLSLLGHFVLAAMGIRNDILARGIAIGLLAVVGVLGWTGGARRVARVERYATAINLSAIFGFLAALAAYGVGKLGTGDAVMPPSETLDLHALSVLLGLLIVVQGFETTRFTGDDFDAPTRINAMRLAQLISGAVYVGFFILLSPLLGELAAGSGVAAVITTSGLVAGVLPISLTLAAVASQFSASIADSLGDAGLIEQITKGEVDPRHAYVLIALVGIGILIATNVNGVIALASRAFALFYAMQCLVAWEAARHRAADKRKSAAFLALAIVSLAVFALGVPAG